MLRGGRAQPDPRCDSLQLKPPRTEGLVRETWWEAHSLPQRSCQLRKTNCVSVGVGGEGRKRLRAMGRSDAERSWSWLRRGKALADKGMGGGSGMAWQSVGGC